MACHRAVSDRLVISGLFTRAWLFCGEIFMAANELIEITKKTTHSNELNEKPLQPMVKQFAEIR